jgi:hypothetical protein
MTAGAGFVIIATAALAGCGQPTVAGPSGAGADAPIKLAPLCAEPAHVRSVRVTRLPTLTQLGPSKAVPRKLPGITVRGAAQARAVARLVCGLPVMPHGVFHCPIAIGGGYQLVFTVGRLPLPAVTVRASGCETVTSAGGHRARWVARSPEFWAKLSRLTGMAAPAHAR